MKKIEYGFYFFVVGLLCMAIIFSIHHNKEWNTPKTNIYSDLKVGDKVNLDQIEAAITNYTLEKKENGDKDITVMLHIRNLSEQPFRYKQLVACQMFDNKMFGSTGMKIVDIKPYTYSEDPRYLAAYGESDLIMKGKIHQTNFSSDELVFVFPENIYEKIKDERWQKGENYTLNYLLCHH